MVVVDRGGERHELRDLTVGIALSGDLDAVHTAGDNANVVPTDTQKNTVFAFAKEAPVGSPEAFALRLGRHFVREFEPIHRARVEVAAVRSGSRSRCATAPASGCSPACAGWW
jgi:urate oxidase